MEEAFCIFIILLACTLFIGNNHSQALHAISLSISIFFVLLLCFPKNMFRNVYKFIDIFLLLKILIIKKTIDTCSFFFKLIYVDLHSTFKQNFNYNIYPLKLYPLIKLVLKTEHIRF